MFRISAVTGQKICVGSEDYKRYQYTNISANAALVVDATIAAIQGIIQFSIKNHRLANGDYCIPSNISGIALSNFMRSSTFNVSGLTGVSNGSFY